VLVIDKMGEISATMESSLKEIRSAVDLLHGRPAVIDTNQQSLVAQISLIANVVKDERLNLMTLTVEQLRVPNPEEDDPDPQLEGGAVVGKGTLQRFLPTRDLRTTSALRVQVWRDPCYREAWGFKAAVFVGALVAVCWEAQVAVLREV
jgi:hypothetical protein